MELPTSPEVRACHSKGNPARAVYRPYPGLLPGLFCFQRHNSRLCHPRQGGRQPPRPYPAHHAGNGRKRQMAPQVPQDIRHPIRPRLRRETEEQKFKRMERHCFRVLSDYYYLLRCWKEEYAPKQPDEAWNSRFYRSPAKHEPSGIPDGRTSIITPSDPKYHLWLPDKATE